MDQEEQDGFAVTRAQGKKETEERKKEVSQKEGGKKADSPTHQPAYCFESKIMDPQAPSHILQRILDVEVPNIKICDLLSLSGELRREMVENTRTHKSPTVGAALVAVPDVPLEFSTPLQEVEVLVMGKQREVGLLDEGSEIVVVREDLCRELGAEVNRERRMTMQTANGGKEDLLGCVEYLELEVGGVKTYAHAFVVREAPYHLLLGRPWQKGVKLGKVEREDGSMDVVVTDPGEEG